MFKKGSNLLFPIFLTYFLDTFGLAVIYPIFTPMILYGEHNLISTALPYFEKTALLGVVVAAFPFAQFFGAPLIGQFSDRIGRKKTLSFTVFGTAIGYTLTATSILLNSFTLLLISRLVTGFFASNLIICLAALADLSPDEPTRARYFGHLATLGGLSFVVAIGFGGLLSSLLSPSMPFWITAALAYLNFLSVHYLFHETHPTKPPTDMRMLKGMHNIILGIRNPDLRPLYIVTFFFMVTWVATMQFLPASLLTRYTFTPLQVTYALIFVGVFWSLANLILNRILSRKAHPPSTLYVCLLILFVSMFGMIFAEDPTIFFLFFYPATVVAALAWTNSLATISLKAPNEIQGSILGINQSMISLASMLAPTLGGLFAGAGKHWIFIFTAFCSLMAFALFYRWKKYHPSNIVK